MSAYGAAFKEAWTGALENVKQRQAMALALITSLIGTAA